MELLFDNEFGLSCSEINEEEGEDTYCYRGEACLTKELVEDLEAYRLVVLQASLRMNQMAIVKEQLGILSRGRLGYINQSVLFGSVNILQN